MVGIAPPFIFLGHVLPTTGALAQRTRSKQLAADLRHALRLNEARPAALLQASGARLRMPRRELAAVPITWLLQARGALMRTSSLCS